MSPSPSARPVVADIGGDGPLVVLLHGQPGSAADWDPVVPRLSPHFTVVAADRPGYGRTGGRALDFDANADAVAELLDRLGHRGALLVGHSWGGGVALAAADRHPDRVRGLVLLASVGPAERVGTVDRLLASRPLGSLSTALAVGGMARLVSVPAVGRHIVPRLPDPAQGIVGTLRRPGRRGGRLGRSFAAEQRFYVQRVGALAAGLGHIAVPVTVVAGTADRIIPADVATRLAAAIPGAELLRVPGVGHLLARDAPRAVADAVTRTARRVEGPH